MSKSLPPGSDPAPAKPKPADAASQEYGDTLPLPAVTNRDDAGDQPTLPLARSAPQKKSSPEGDATRVEQSLKDASFVPTVDVGAENNGTLDFVVAQAKRKAAAVLHTTVGDYEIERELGRGGMGVVYKARHRQLHRDVALKMILSGKHAGPEQLQRFLVEAQAVAHLQHPNIVQIFDIGEHEGLPYFSLEFVDGQSLSQYINRRPQPAQEAAQTLEVLARAMQSAHDHGVLHRDLKPANVLLTQDGTPKISDFGLAKKCDDEESESTRTGTVMGTPSYMSPEQALGLTHDLGPASDQYSLGAMLYEMLTGRPPFIAAKAVDTILQVIHDEPVRPRQLQPTAPVDLETICLKALQKDIDKRYASCLDLAADLRRFLNGEPIEARPVSSTERLWRWCKRNPRVAIPSFLALIGLLAVTVISSWSFATVSRQNFEIVRERNKAVDNEKLATAAKAVAETERKKADASAATARKQRGLALDTLYKVVTKVDEKLKDRSDMRDLRKELMTDAMEGLEQVEQSDDTKSLIDRSMGVGHQRMADILQQMGSTEESARQQERALAIFQSLIAANDKDDWAKWDAALSLDSLGNYHQRARVDAARARECFVQALKLREQLHAGLHIQEPGLTASTVEQSLVNSYAKLGSMELQEGKDAAAREYLVKMLKHSESLLAADPKNVRARQAMAGSYLTLGGMSIKQKDATAAATFFDKALEFRESLAAENQQSLKAQSDLAALLSRRGDLELQLKNRPAAAVPYYERALKTYQAMYQRDEKDAEVSTQLASCYHRLGTAHLLLGQKEAAAVNFQAALPLRRTLASADAKNTSKQIEFVHSLARVGSIAEASELAEKLVPRVAKDSRGLYNLACGFAICATSGDLATSDATRMEHYVDRALEVLQQAVQVGYRDVAALETDPDLAVLRSEDRFQAVINGLKKPNSSSK